MTINSSFAQVHTSEQQIDFKFHIVAALFNFCLVVQVLTVGLAYFYKPEWWNLHVWLVRGYGGLSLILAVWAYFGSFPSRVQGLATSLPVLLGLQFVTIHLKSAIPLGVLHPLIGFTLFSVSTSLVHKTSPRSLLNSDPI